MNQIARSSVLRSILGTALFTIVSGCAATPTPANVAATSQPTTEMAGCGMMVDGKMVYTKPVQGGCMTMNKPGNMMPAGVTMHADPAAHPRADR